jgi:OpgC protein
MPDRGFIAAATRLLERAWHIDVAHVFPLTIDLTEISYLAQTDASPEFASEFTISEFLRAPVATIYEGLILRCKPVNMDVPALYIVLMLVFPPIPWVMLRRPHLTFFGSVLLYFSARLSGWKLPGYPSGVWYFSLFAWQLLFMFGAWCALGGPGKLRPLPPGLDATFDDDKTNLPPYRFIHFVVLALFLVRSLPRDRPALQWRGLRPAIVCGVLRRHLPVVCRAFRAGRHIRSIMDATVGEHDGYRHDPPHGKPAAPRTGGWRRQANLEMTDPRRTRANVRSRHAAGSRSAIDGTAGCQRRPSRMRGVKRAPQDVRS